MKLIGFCIAQHSIRKAHRKPQNLEKIFLRHISDKDLISRINKALSKLNIKKAKFTIINELMIAFYK